MATTLLIVGYLLVVPALLVLPKAWRQKWWLVYVAEVVGTLMIAVGWALRLSLLPMAIHAAWGVAFGVTFPLFAGRAKRLWVVVSTGLAVVLLLGAVGYGVIRTRFRITKVSKESTGQAVSDFRRSSGASLKESQGRTPPPGVYEYAATGFYKVTVKGLGTDKRVLPKKVPAVLVAKDNCWELTVRYFKQHHWTVRYCNDPKLGLRMMWLRNSNTYFGIKNDSRSSCEPDALLRPGDKPPSQWSQECRPKDPNPFFGKAKATAVARYVAVEGVNVGGRKIQAHHIHRSVVIKSLMAAKVEQHLWYTKSGMMVKFRVKAEGTGVASFNYDYGITLLNLAPKR